MKKQLLQFLREAAQQCKQAAAEVKWRTVERAAGMLALLFVLIYALVIRADRNDWRDMCLEKYAQSANEFKRYMATDKENRQLRIYKKHYEAVAKQIEELQKRDPRVNEIIVDAAYKVSERYNLNPDSVLKIIKGEVFYTTQWIAHNNSRFQY